jgi:hypothetical protein
VQQGDNITVKASVPGVNPEDLDVSILRWAKTTQDVEDMDREITMHISKAGFVPSSTEFRELKPAGAVAVTAVVPGS